ncbi:unnamed protein product [Trifolium pratense]|uniref:Uncharacterized protein n=1 Tax=Trifolium pratense TaxID=57577 RepID=A0ACB0LY71_TRIPR|nr:unnamed protein product [Trifolium pratense]
MAVSSLSLVILLLCNSSIAAKNPLSPPPPDPFKSQPPEISFPLTPVNNTSKPQHNNSYCSSPSWVIGLAVGLASLAIAASFQVKGES